MVFNNFVMLNNKNQSKNIYTVILTLPSIILGF